MFWTADLLFRAFEAYTKKVWETGKRICSANKRQRFFPVRFESERDCEKIIGEGTCSSIRDYNNEKAHSYHEIVQRSANYHAFMGKTSRFEF